MTGTLAIFMSYTFFEKIGKGKKGKKLLRPFYSIFSNISKILKYDRLKLDYLRAKSETILFKNQRKKSQFFEYRRFYFQNGTKNKPEILKKHKKFVFLF